MVYLALSFEQTPLQLFAPRVHRGEGFGLLARGVLALTGVVSVLVRMLLPQLDQSRAKAARFLTRVAD
jgi:hypothetical protein